MTSSQIARVLHGRRIGKGKWIAKCPSHPDRSPSLSITDMGKGNTRLHCFTGCSQQAVLEAAGLFWRDLRSGEPDPFWEQQRRDREYLTLLERQESLAIMASVMFPEERDHWNEVEATCALERRDLMDKLDPSRKQDREREMEVQRIIAEYGIPELIECLNL